ncbi:4050_t:CDS:2 [Diversispora eburnea]|uniref:Probable quinone oxidoreductase n=1 Tax=Diversispora eburnea TaxID=1213867 RepID=A0A9N9F6S2_9GLOM|nr:4050_t:CDS:2 [Diversispora eburnea]
MKAIKIKNTGGPEVLKYEEIPRPEITDPDDVLIKNHFMGVNFIDIYHRSGDYKIPLPAVLGREGAGVVDSVGNNVKDIVPGNHVVYFGGSSYAEYTKTSTKYGLTAYTFVTQAYSVKNGDWILIQAAAGGVGGLLTQLVKNFGAHVIGTVSSPEKAELAKKAGAEYVINSTSQDVVKEIMQITNNEGVHAVYDGVGKATLETSLNCVRRLGTFISYGNASGMIPPFDIYRLSAKNVKLARPTIVNYIYTKEEFQQCTKELFDLIINGKLNIKIWKIYKLSEVRQAHEDLAQRKTSGKLLLEP